MKKLVVNIHAELEVPDDWELVRHPSGISVLKVGDRFVAGVVFHTGPMVFQLEEKIIAAPIASLWS